MKPQQKEFKDNEPFFMVYLEGGSNPAFRHATLLDAEIEAKRLSQRYGKKAYILATIKAVKNYVCEITDLRPTDDLPF